MIWTLGPTWWGVHCIKRILSFPNIAEQTPVQPTSSGLESPTHTHTYTVTCSKQSADLNLGLFPGYDWARSRRMREDVTYVTPSFIGNLAHPYRKHALDTYGIGVCTRVHCNVNTVFPDIRIPFIMVRRSHYRLAVVMGISIPVGW